MDNIVAESSDTMINSLNFGLPETSQYITDRRFVNYFCSGGEKYTATSGNKNIRFYISGEDNTYLDLSSVRLFATIENKDESSQAKFLRPLGGLHSFIQRYRCTVGGQMCQDIIEYNRHCELYESFKPKDVRDMDDIESNVASRWDSDVHNYANGLDVLLQATTAGVTPTPGVVTVSPDGDKNEWGRIDKRYTRHSLTGIPGGGKGRYSHNPCCGLMQSNYYLPLRYAPLELEFTIVNDELLPIVNPQGDEGTVPAENDLNGYYFQAGNTSTKWEINNVIIRAETITLDNTVNNNIVSHLLQGQPLKLVFPMYHTLTQTFNTNGGELNMNIVKSSSKLTGAFITLYRTPRTGKLNNRFLPDNYVYKRWNYFYNPMINSFVWNNADGVAVENQGKGLQDYTRNLSWQIQLGNKKYPEFEAQSLSETFYYLRRAIHYMNPDQDALSFSYKQYRSDKFVIGMSFEKMSDVNFTGVNTKMGSLITMKLRPEITLNTTAGADNSGIYAEDIQEVFTHLISETVLELRESGSIIYD